MVQPDSELFTFGVAWVLCEAAGLAAGALVKGFSGSRLKWKALVLSALVL